MASRYEDIPPERQQARAAFTILALYDAIMRLPDSFAATERDQETLDRIVDSHCAVSGEIGAQKLPKRNAAAVMHSLNRFLKHGKKKRKSRAEKDRWLVARFWCAILFVWDARATCPAFCRTEAWEKLDAALDELGRAFLNAYEGADLLADQMYMELTWA